MHYLFNEFQRRKIQIIHNYRTIFLHNKIFRKNLPIIYTT